MIMTAELKIKAATRLVIRPGGYHLVMEAADASITAAVRWSAPTGRRDALMERELVPATQKTARKGHGVAWVWALNELQFISGCKFQGRRLRKVASV